ncbi:RNA polymerase sigma factor [Aestuariivivens insulae]|uniref:RNA polymerase sigma factor n=1 Tax=Aestuariivivens insulae TaxID=1621988 RepID=UPI001F57AB98|nr:sigma-70 family RNA polymerase sigma factor [Aestuariivivens insulae]
MESDSKLVKAIKQGDTTAFNTLYSKYWERLFSFVYGLSKSEVLSKDIVQDVFISFWERRGTLKVVNVEAYLFQSVKFAFFQAYKKKKFNTETLHAAFENHLIDHVSQADQDVVHSLMHCIEALPQRRKEILYLRKFQDFSIKEIALELNISNQTVKNQMGLALKQLKESLKKVALTFF